MTVCEYYLPGVPHILVRKIWSCSMSSLGSMWIARRLGNQNHGCLHRHPAWIITLDLQSPCKDYIYIDTQSGFQGWTHSACLRGGTCAMWPPPRSSRSWQRQPGHSAGEWTSCRCNSRASFPPASAVRCRIWVPNQVFGSRWHYPARSFSIPTAWEGTGQSPESHVIPRYVVFSHEEKQHHM